MDRRKLALPVVAVAAAALVWWLRSSATPRPEAAVPVAESGTLAAETGAELQVVRSRLPGDAGGRRAATDARAPAPPAVQVELIEWHGRPAAEAVVALLPEKGGLVVGKTDELGRAEFDPSIDAGILFVRREAAPAWRSPEPIGRGPARIQIPKGAELTGRVLVYGRPPDAPIVLRLVTSSANLVEGLELDDRLAVVRLMHLTEVEVPPPLGAFHIVGLAPNARGRLIPPEGLRLEFEGGSFTFERPTSGLDLRLVRDLRGRVVDKPSGLFVAGAEVRVLFSGFHGIRSDGRTDANGHFIVGGADPAEVDGYTIHVDDAQGQRWGRHEGGPLPPDLDLGEIRVAFEVDLRFRVVDPGGTPIADVRAELVSGSDGWPMPARRLTDFDGRSSFAMVPEDARVARFSAKSFRDREMPLPAARGEEWQVTLEGGNRLEFTVAARAPRWMLGCTLRVQSPDALAEQAHERSLRGPSFPLLVENPGPGILEVDLLDAAGVSLWSRSLPPLGATETRRVEIPSLDPGSVRGTVLDSAGKPLFGARVRTRGAGGGFGGDLVSGRDGEFEAGPFAADFIDVLFHAERHCQRIVRDVPTRGGPGLVVRLDQGHAFEVLVHDGSGKPMDGWWSLRAVTDEGIALQVQRQESGLHGVLHAPEGPVRVTLELGGLVYERTHLPPAPRLDFEVPPHGFVSVRWYTGFNHRSTFTLRCERTGRESVRTSQFFGAEGGTLEPALPGTYTARVKIRGPSDEERELHASGPFVVRAGDTTRITLR